ncbi:hypothetical protein FEM48_Zijuj08G0079100 [Ziziphus jujuba var. spinosa]|uniref:Uncharacterized protein n=1 Tax=Ziziphus jujuba var. spinosa TaxID=714518 RepID=A0A978UXW7_ZIZJJ|nr:hypothetical protein FEM48_Zijuj08G0079100 [Ziziphus jujuba var. spinosa]
MGVSLRSNKGFLSSFRTLINQQRFKFNHTLTEVKPQDQVYPESGPDYVAFQSHMDMSKWKKLDSRSFGIHRFNITEPSRIVLNILRKEGFEAYLVGGCIRKKFRRAYIVGRRFPICMVRIKDTVIEVSSFDTVASQIGMKKEHHSTHTPHGCDKKDFILWRNSMQRDFTVNSLFFDPFMNKIYDYADGLVDLRSSKLRTLIPAQLSFKEDSARILRGIRLAARLGLSFSKDVETAIRNLSSSIMHLAEARIMMELNYMLSYGAAEPSLCLLQRFNLLKILLPFQAAYLDQQHSVKTDQSSMMLMKLFFSLDKLVTCDRPINCRLWIAILAFHIALVKNPQDARVIVAFASILYLGEWKEGIKFARENTEVQVNFIPEILRSFKFKSDEELAKEVSQFASSVQYSIDALIDKESLSNSMTRYPIFQSSGLVFVSKKMGQDVAEIFQVLANNIESYKNRRKSFKIDYNMLGQGHLCETRFVLGKVILETMSCGTLEAGEDIEQEINHMHQSIMDENDDMELYNKVKKQVEVKKDRRQELAKKHISVKKKYSPDEEEVVLGKHGVVETEECEEITKENQKVHETFIEISDQENMPVKSTEDEEIENMKEDVEKCQDKDQRPLRLKKKADNQQKAIRQKIKRYKQNSDKERESSLILSSLFK